MSIIIRTRDTGGIFDTPINFRLEVQNTSAIFNDLGSKTVSASLPITDNNAVLLGFAHRSDVAYSPDVKIPVVIEFRSYVRYGMLYMSTAYNSDKTFGITIAFDEGIMYENMDSILLTELTNLPIIEKSVEDLIADMNNLFKNGTANDELSVFQIVFQYHEYEESGVPYAHSLNDGNLEGLEIYSKINIIVDNKLQEIDVPIGFGISPFIKVWKVLEYIFGYFGYKINNNPFKEDYQLKCLCVLNNTYDAIVSGRLNYSQLLPAVTVREFLQALYCRFGLKVFFDGSRNEVNLHLLKDILQAKDAETLSDHTPLDLDYQPARQLKLSAAKNLDKSSTETETYEEFLRKYNNTVNILDSRASNDFDYELSGVFIERPTGIINQISSIFRRKKLLSSIHFDWNKKDKGIETEEISSIDECLTLTSNSVPYFGLNPNLRNSTLTINAEEDVDMMSDDNKLAFCYGMEGFMFDNEQRYSLGRNWGYIFPYDINASESYYTDRQGNVFKYALTFVGEDGAFNRFFKDYDAILRHSNRLAKTTVHASLTEMSGLRFNNKFHSEFQPLLLDKVNYQLGEETSDNSINATVEARTLRLYKPYDLEKEQHLPVPSPIRFKWIRTNNKDLVVETLRSEKEIETRSEFASTPGYAFISFKVSNVSDPNPPSGDFWFLPPTETQFTNQIRIGQTSHDIEVTFIHTYHIITEQHTAQIKSKTKYLAWFKAEEV